MIYTVATFYKFVPLPDYEAMREPLAAFCRAHGAKGSILLASEGINATIAAPREGIDAIIGRLRSDERLTDMLVKESSAEFQPFLRMKVRLKKEIVTLRQDVDPTNLVGNYVQPAEWNDLISDPEVFLIDTRNDFEVQVGSFEGAVNPNTTSFSQFADYVRDNLDPERHKKIAMFCTGGIRCEKATSYLLKNGFDDVYHLEGGILNYLEKVPESETKWHGECFVFDNRVTLDHNLEPGSYILCHSCWQPLTSADIDSPLYDPGVACPHCDGELSDERRASLRERQKQIALAKARGEQHLGS